MPSRRVIAHQRKEIIEESKEYTDYVEGLTGGADSPNASYGLTPPLTWVTLSGARSAVPVVNVVMNPNIVGVDVGTAINVRTGRREITGVLPEAYNHLPASLIQRASSPAPSSVDAIDSLPGRVEPDTDSGGLVILMRRFMWKQGKASPSDARYDLTSEVAALSDTARGVLVYADPADEALHVQVGAEQMLGYPFTQADFDAIGLPYATFPLAGLVLYAGQTNAADSFVPNTRYFDRRHFVEANGIVEPGWLVKTPTKIPAGATMVVTGNVRVTDTLIVEGSLYII